MSGIMNRIIRWQLENPDGGVPECKAWLREEHARMGLGKLPPAASAGDQPVQKKKKKVEKVANTTE